MCGTLIFGWAEELDKIEEVEGLVCLDENTIRSSGRMEEQLLERAVSELYILSLKIVPTWR